MGNYLLYYNDDALSAEFTLNPGFNYDLLIVIFLSDGTGLDDYPDSPGPAHVISSDDANSILDSEEPPQAMDCTAGHSGRPDSGNVQHGGSDIQCRKRKASTWSEPVSACPSLPPIYHSVAKKKIVKERSASP